MIAVFGSGGALGTAIADHFHAGSKETVVRLTRKDADLRSDSDVEQLFARLASDHPPTDPWHIVNAAATCYNSSIRKADPQRFLDEIENNLMGSVYILKYAAEHFRSRPHSSVTLLSSVVASRGVFGAASYGASKAALAGLVRSVAPEYARYGARVNVLELGYFDKGMIAKVEPEYRDQLLRAIPLNRFGNMFELGHAVEFVARNTYLTGAVVPLNGGLL